MKKGQGSLEYLIIVAAVLAVAAIVVLFVTGAIGPSRDSGNLNACRASLASVYNEAQMNGAIPADITTGCQEACRGTDGVGLCSDVEISQEDINGIDLD